MHSTKIRNHIENSSRTHKTLSRRKKHLIFRNLIESVNESAAAFDVRDRVSYANPAFLKLSEYSQNEVIGKKSTFFFRKSDHNQIQTETAKRANGISSRYEITLITKSEKKIPVLVSGSPLAGGGSIGIFTDLRIIKGWNEKLRELNEYERRLAAILESSVDAIVSIDKSRHIQTWNKGAEKLFGYESKEVVGKIVDFIIPAEHREQKEIEKMRHETKKKGFLKNYETVRQTKSGKLISINISQAIERDTKGKIVGYTTIYRDISENKKWEEELQNRFDKLQLAYMEMGRQRRYLDFFEELIDMAFNKKKSSDIASYIVNAFAMISQVDAITYRAYRKNQKDMELQAFSGIGNDWLKKKYIPLSGSLFEKIYKLKAPIRILDIWSEPHFHSPVLARKYDLRSVLFYPLFAGEEFMGSISLYVSSKSPITLLDNEFIGIFAKEVALVLKYLS